MQVKNYAIRKYEPGDASLWNAFIDSAKNATFLFNRGFMDYHCDRFADFSLLAFDAGKLIAVLPANQLGQQVFSHQGLSYGGLVFDSKTRFETIAVVFRNMLEFFHTQKITTLQLKTIPAIYCETFSDETAWMLFTLNAKLVRRDCLSVVNLKKPFRYSENKTRNIKKAATLDLKVVEETNFSAFWQQVLIPNLQSRHAVAPVHSLEEITLLHGRFPKNIRQFNVYLENKIVGGTTVFESENVAHCQYISGLAETNKLGTLDFLFDHLLQQVFREKPYFDFGISNENKGRNINGGLLRWKESFGAGLLSQDFYEIETANHTSLTTILL